ncbi:BPL/LPL catalytic domain-containing protein [Aphelenchoides fujianensis]|nr:BPL/LPL catalytic domain-containing protein [Aphelenchoides fujianensis]
MLFFAWSLVSSAIHYARRRRLLSVLQTFVRSPAARNSALICRRLKLHVREEQPKRNGRNSLGNLQTASEPVLDRIGRPPVVLFRTEEAEILSAEPLDFDLDEWTPAFFSDNQLVLDGSRPRVVFTIQARSAHFDQCGCPGGRREFSAPNTVKRDVDSLANRIAVRKGGRSEMLYETHLQNFCSLVLYWAEGILCDRCGRSIVAENQLSAQARPLLEALSQNNRMSSNLGANPNGLRSMREFGGRELRKRAAYASDTLLNFLDGQSEELTGSLWRFKRDVFNASFSAPKSRFPLVQPDGGRSRARGGRRESKSVGSLNFLAARKTRRRVASLTPHSSALPPKDFAVQVGNTRRRSLSPLSLTLLANYGSKEAIDSISSQHFAALSTDAIFQRNKTQAAPKRRVHTMSNGETPDGGQNGAPADEKPRMKPPTVLIYTGDRKDLYERICTSLQGLLPHDVYVLSHLSTHSMRHHPWVDENAACLLIADTKPLDDQAWTRLQSYFVHAGKILFVCQNSLFASLTNCDSVKKQMGKEDQPLLLYIENSEHKASALFTDITTDQLLSVAGRPLIAEAISRLGIRVGEETPPPPLTRGYLICHNDRLVFDMRGLSYGEEIGQSPRLFFRSTEQIAQEEELPEPSASLLPVESGFPDGDFDPAVYFERLQTKSLNRAFPDFDGIVVTTSTQLGGVGRGGNQWLSPKGCAMFAFDFNIPTDSELGANIVFLQHILAVSMVDAVLSLLNIHDFPLKIKWPNDLYYGRFYKMGGILVSASSQGGFMRCIISAGLNVANSHPTVCINDMIPADCTQTLGVEETLAEIMNKFEYYVNVFVNRGKQEFTNVYLQHWLHSREEVSIVDEDTGAKDRVVIRGLDPNGYLEVRSKQTGRVFSVFDDGNTFDLMKNLIRPKSRA